MFRFGETIPVVTVNQFTKNFDCYWAEIADHGKTYHIKTPKGAVALAPFRDESKWKTVHLNLPDDVWQLLQTEAVRRSISVNLLVTLMLQAHFAERKVVKKSRNPLKKSSKKK